jgi:uncharacterized membrane protein
MESVILHEVLISLSPVILLFLTQAVPKPIHIVWVRIYLPFPLTNVTTVLCVILLGSGNLSIIILAIVAVSLLLVSFSFYSP